jgi:hypothetical protein
MNTNFDKDSHQYYIDDRPVPSVTQILGEVLSGATWKASEWHMQRGTAVHACMALLAQSKCFDYDIEIDGQVTAGRRFFAEIDPRVLYVEQRYYCDAYQFAGTVDLIAVLKNKITIIDWKSALSPIAEIQIGGYGLLYPQATHGMVVALQEDGNYKCGQIFKLERKKAEFLACLSVYNLMKRLGLIKRKEEDGNGTNRTC